MGVSVSWLLQECLVKLLISLSYLSLKVFHSSLEFTKSFIGAETALWLKKGL